MELVRIEELLEKYFEGETSLSEEQKLKAYFAGEQVAPHLEQYIPLFQYFSNESHTTANRETRVQKQKIQPVFWVGIAASIAIVIGLFTMQPFSKSHQKEFGTYEDPELALQKTKEVLDLVAQYMNEGKKDLVYLNEFESTKNKLMK